jgi:RNA polymerase sigma factor (sigma-70 family)
VITFLYLYKQCYPLFNAVYKRYKTDCETTEELIDEIYVYIMLPNKTTGRCKLAGFGFRCTLTMWLKIVVENYCKQLYNKTEDFQQVGISEAGDRKVDKLHSIDLDVKSIERQDLNRILSMMPNKRYRELIQYRYVEKKSNEETAALLSLTMSNYYNVHLRAKEQFCNALRKEGLL